ncbi:hypothetical protein C4J81_03380 [Deltaproteobacteria bacterium Smac51]|nr:hypothetical protein C4J81_03380 [Deltaproteobacteria bacterium Smac51]
MSNRSIYASAALMAAAALFAVGCSFTTTKSSSDSVDSDLSGRASQTWRSPDVSDAWKHLADDMARRGLNERKLEQFFKSSSLVYTSGPMETKLRELYGIFYRSELTKEIQEKLYQLGYDITIDGRAGSGTRGVVTRFQADNGLTQTGDISDATLASINKVMKTAKTRSLSSYSPPSAKKPSRTATYPQFTKAGVLPTILAHYRADRELFNAMSRKYNVPGEVAAAIMWVETGYGNYFGKHLAASQLASMAAAAYDFDVVAPAVSDLVRSDGGAKTWLKDTAVKRGGWAADELAALLSYSFQNGHDPTSFPGSIYGAIGYGQFMPSNVLKYGVDGSGDGKVDMFNKADAIYSIGNYLKAHGWTGGGMSEEARRAVIMKYNKSGVYVNTVLYVADWLAANK